MQVVNLAGISEGLMNTEHIDSDDEAPQPLNVKISPMKNAHQYSVKYE
jgi:hypothetical protein